MQGLIHIYTGNGKGKTSAAVGLGMRAYGRGLKVLMVQFLKGAETGEIFTIEKLGSGFLLQRGKEVKKFTWNMNEEELNDLKQSMSELFKASVESASKSECDVLIWDELLGAISTGLIEINEVISFLKNKPEGLEVIMTGRNAPKELVDISHYVSEINAAKHPFDKGIKARMGIEY